MVIIFTDASNVIGRFFSTQLLVVMGLISYSAYLWHQPIFAFVRVYSFDYPSIAASASGTFASFVMAYLTWRFVEQPARLSRFTRMKTFGFAAIGLLIIFAVGFSGHLQLGQKDRLALISEFEMQRSWQKGCLLFGEQTRSLSEACRFNKTSSLENGNRVLLWGDSHADSLQVALEKLGPTFGFTVSSMTTASCPPSLGLSVMGNDCHERNLKVLNELETQPRYDAVILAGAWNRYVNVSKFMLTDWVTGRPVGDDKVERIRLIERGLEETLTRLESLDVQIVLVGGMPQFTKSVPDALIRRYIIKRDENFKVRIAHEGFLDQTEMVRKAFDRIAVKYPAIELFEPSFYFLTNSGDFVFGEFALDPGGKQISSYFYDEHHLSETGASKVAGPLLKKLKSRIKGS